MMNNRIADGIVFRGQAQDELHSTETIVSQLDEEISLLEIFFCALRNHQTLAIVTSDFARRAILTQTIS
jgi:hypothetical protein